jgi:drug/metabolite transporter (DMT)-like permease
MKEHEKRGEIYMVILAFFESWFPIIILFTYQFLTPVFSYAFTMFFAAFILTFFSVIQGNLISLKDKEGMKYLFLTTLFITLLFLCVFLGLKYTTASNMAVILFMQLFFSFLYFNVIGNEAISSKSILGAILMGAGAIGVLFPEDLNFNKGDLLVLIAAMLAPIANYYQKRARAYYSADVILSFRNMISFPILFLIAFFIEPLPSLENLLMALPYLLISGLIIMGLAKILWVEAIYLISITKATALSALVPLFTIIFAYIVLNETPTVLQIISSLPIIIGGYFITRKTEH